jgi:hypothetical protein
VSVACSQPASAGGAQRPEASERREPGSGSASCRSCDESSRERCSTPEGIGAAIAKLRKLLHENDKRRAQRPGASAQAEFSGKAAAVIICSNARSHRLERGGATVYFGAPSTMCSTLEGIGAGESNHFDGLGPVEWVVLNARGHRCGSRAPGAGHGTFVSPCSTPGGIAAGRASPRRRIDSLSIWMNAKCSTPEGIGAESAPAGTVSSCTSQKCSTPGGIAAGSVYIPMAQPIKTIMCSTPEGIGAGRV